ncbi:WD40-repeat-containing domain protein [Crassisporium funariophilum]|nr:WD40-repeat-containing domain protein [Crassisporium funariophilum]
MLDSQHLLPQSHTTPQPPTKHTSKSTTQHGIHIILLHVPAETLTGITSYLDPPALCALAAVNVYLHEHVKDDNTWRRAFVYQFLGIGPESDLDDQKTTLLLRPAEHSWRQEFTVRYRVARRWERSRNATTTHIPVNSPISSMHLMSSQSPVHYLLTSSLQYGIIARSIPLTGRILPGYLDASASAAVQGFGMGNGNPNAQFTPNVSACAITSDGGKAKVVWGTRVGDVLFMVAPRAMEGGGRTGRSGVEMKRCRVGDEHAGAVLDAQWLDSEWTVVTAGADGRVKLWDAKTGTCQWTSPTKPNVFIPDPCVKVMISASSVIAGVMKSGDIHLWTGVEFRETIIPCPILTSTQGYNPDVAHGLTALHIDPNSPTSKPTLLVAYEYDPYFYRVFVDLTKEDEESINTTAFGDPFFGAISSIVPFFRSKSMSETSFVLAGDHFGCVSLYSWDSTTSDIVGPQRKIEAHPDSSSVTAIAWNSYTLVTGSARGTTHVFDALTWRHLRSFASPVPRVRGGRHAHHPVVVGAVGAGNAQGNANEEEMEAQRQRERQSVRHIVLSPTERDILFVGVGDRVMAWKAGAVPRHASGGVRGRHASGTAVGKKKRAGGKYMRECRSIS